MALTSATLGAQLQAISGSTEGAAITAWSGAWATYFAGAVANKGGGVSFTTNPTTIAAARAAMESAMTGLSTSLEADDKVQTGIIAWWDYLEANPGACFADAIIIDKPDLTGIAAALVPIFADNQDNTHSAAVSCAAIAASLHGTAAGNVIIFNLDDNSYEIA